MPSIPTWGYALVSIVVGIGVVWWMLRRIDQAEADRIEKLSTENYVKGMNQATDAEKAEQKAKDEIDNDKTDRPVNQW